MALKKKVKKEMGSKMAKTPKQSAALPGTKKKRAKKVAPIRGY